MNAIQRWKLVILITALQASSPIKDDGGKKVNGERRRRRRRRYFALMPYHVGTPLQFHLEVFQIAETFPARGVLFQRPGRNVASGNEILPKVVGTADQADLASSENYRLSHLPLLFSLLSKANSLAKVSFSVHSASRNCDFDTSRNPLPFKVPTMFIREIGL